MSVLDLQGMESTAPATGDSGGGSSHSQSCPSNLSLALCNGGSGLSVLACHD